MTALSDFMQARKAYWKVQERRHDYRLLCSHCSQSCVVQKAETVPGGLGVAILDHERMHMCAADNLSQTSDPR